MIAKIAQHKIELSFRFVFPSGDDICRRFERCMVVGAVAVHAAAWRPAWGLEKR